MKELPESQEEIALHYKDSIEGKVEEKFLRVEFTRNVWFEPSSTFEISVTYFVEHELKEAGSLSDYSPNDIKAEIDRDPRFYIQENKGFVARVSLMISQVTTLFGGSPLVLPPQYMNEEPPLSQS